VATEAQFAAAFGFAFLTALAATPVAIRVARRTAFYDYPQRYKAHAQPTPYLGGAAVLTGFALGAVLLAREWSTTLPILAGALLLWLVGTIDDRRTLGPWKRVLATVGAAIFLSATGLGWEVSGSESLNLALTALWVVAIVNAFNLMDNIDGAAGAVGAVVAAGIAVLALIESADVVAALALALCGACLAFMRFNLRSPGASIFLGDGGSMTIGFVVAAAVMSLPIDETLGWASVVPATLLVGLPIFDTALVVASRRRRHAVIWRGARDHVTHRLLPRLGSTTAVCVSIATLQAILSTLAVFVAQGDTVVILLVATVALPTAIAAMVALEALAPVAAVSPMPLEWIEPKHSPVSGRPKALPSVRAVAAANERRQ
jgi:UDP-GlcNAc:undecaprenyl-phosphate GlcNAc-1-phosphate transferase